MSAREKYERECPILMSYGMSRDEYWNGDILSAFDYVEAEVLRKKQLNEQLWLQGMYMCDAVAVAVNNTVCYQLANGKGEKAHYPERPYGADLTAKEKEDKEEKDKLQAEMWLRQFVEVGKNWGKEK